VWFWECGNLLETAKVFNEFAASFSALELDKLLNLEKKWAMLNLFRKGNLYTEKILGS
jgi:hypothetical protein